MQEGAYTKQLTPAFPSLTFPSHTTEATGVYVDGHGIPGNAFYDTSTGQTVRFPDDSSLVRAEPIWITAERQGVRTAVIDWPLSGLETGPVKADYFNDAFDNNLTDAQRVQKLIDVWTSDKGATPLRLLIGYMHDTDVVGHSKGPDRFGESRHSATRAHRRSNSRNSPRPRRHRQSPPRGTLIPSTAFPTGLAAAGLVDSPQCALRTWIALV
jgi:predicted AlkP superfamily pyrophosphatase or phosphodiesterase